MTSRFYRKNAAKVRFQGAKGVKSSVLRSERAQKDLKWGPQSTPKCLFCRGFGEFYQNYLKNCRGHQKTL